MFSLLFLAHIYIYICCDKSICSFYESVYS